MRPSPRFAISPVLGIRFFVDIPAIDHFRRRIAFGVKQLALTVFRRFAICNDTRPFKRGGAGQFGKALDIPGRISDRLILQHEMMGVFVKQNELARKRTIIARIARDDR